MFEIINLIIYKFTYKVCVYVHCMYVCIYIYKVRNTWRGKMEFFQ